MGSIKINVNMRESAPGIVGNCVLIGNSFLELDKISYIQKCTEGSNDMGAEWIAFDLICDGILFYISFFYRHHFENMNPIKTKDVEAFKKFNLDLIDARFDDTKRDLNKRYI